MALKLHFHPLSSYCWKVLIVLYESGLPFEPHIVHLGDEASRAAFVELWPMGKMPVLEDGETGRITPESTIILEYLALRYPQARWLLPADGDAALQVRLHDRLYDLYLQTPMQKIVADRLRPKGEGDPHGVQTARGVIHTALHYFESIYAAHPPMTEAFSLADCAAAPALFYANKVAPFDVSHHPLACAYLRQLSQRPSVARVLDEARPFLQFFPEA